MHKSIPSSVFAALLAAFVLTLGNWGTAIAGGDKLSSDTRKELAQARRATARYHNIANALNDGYSEVEPPFVLPGVGCHLWNLDLLFGDNGDIDLEHPELLIYSDCSGDLGGGSELRAIEYARPCDGLCDDDNLPEGFSGDNDVWEVFGDNILWTLHAWVWRHNPDGIFVKINPRIED
jgi:PAS domain-containing protein